MLDERKITQVAAYILNKAGGEMHPIKLMSLMYLADRESYDKYGFSITGDDAIATIHGPALAYTMELITGTAIESSYWDSVICNRCEPVRALCYWGT